MAQVILTETVLPRIDGSAVALACETDTENYNYQDRVRAQRCRLRDRLDQRVGRKKKGPGNAKGGHGVNSEILSQSEAHFTSSDHRELVTVAVTVTVRVGFRVQYQKLKFVGPTLFGHNTTAAGKGEHGATLKETITPRELI